MGYGDLQTVLTHGAYIMLGKNPDLNFNWSRILFFASGQSVNPDDPSLYSISLSRRTSACQDGEGTATLEIRDGHESISFVLSKRAERPARQQQGC